MSVWRLKKGADRRVRAGHPWVFEKELQMPPKGHTPGAPVELQDDQGKFVARGYGNLQSQIAFRAVSFDPLEKAPLEREALLAKVLGAWKSRFHLGLKDSARIVFSEADFLPGIVIDRYVLAANGPTVQVFAIQVLTAGMGKALGELETFFRNLSEQAVMSGLTDVPWERTAVVVRNDVSVRELEGLREEPARFIKSVREIDFTDARIRLNRAAGEGSIDLYCDLFQGQKTGFFLDQTMNISTVCGFLRRDSRWSERGGVVRVLDLCCYVGHWSSQIASTLKGLGVEVETTLVDVSARALEFAKRNAEAQGARVVSREADVLKSLGSLPSGFDIVVADPPAFVKARKDLPTGQHAYMKLNEQAFRLIGDRGGYVVSCSCSGLVTEEDFRLVVDKGLRRSGRLARLIARGGPAPDHPGRLSFPDGHYLKMFVHQVAEASITGAGNAGAVPGD